MDLTEEVICQRFYWPGIILSVQKELSSCETSQRTKQSDKKDVKLPSKKSEKIPCNKIYVDLIGPCIIGRKGKKENFKS